MSVKKFTILSVLVALTVVFEQVLSFLPNIQVTCLLIVIISTSFEKKSIFLAILVYVTLDNLIGGFTYLYPFMFISWLIFALIINQAKDRNEFILALISMIFGFLHMLILAVPTIFILRVDPIVYFMSDIPYTAVFMLVNFLTVFWLYKPLKKIIENYI